MTEEARLLALIAEKCSSISISKWSVQVITNENKWYTAYFAAPPSNRHPNSDVKMAFVPHNDKLGALLAVLKEIK